MNIQGPPLAGPLKKKANPAEADGQPSFFNAQLQADLKLEARNLN